MNGKRLVLYVGLVNLAWTLSLFLAPATLEPGTLHGLDGNANLLDHASHWATLPWFPRLIYTLGDINCHQMESRSWFVDGNQMPVDARMTAGFVMGNAGFAIALLVPSRPFLRDEAVQVLPRWLRRRLEGVRRRQWALGIMWLAAGAPLVLDVALQALGFYESTNLRRAWTGALFGLGVGFLVAATFDSLLASPASARAAPAPERSDEARRTDRD